MVIWLLGTLCLYAAFVVMVRLGVELRDIYRNPVLGAPLLTTLVAIVSWRALHDPSLISRCEADPGSVRGGQVWRLAAAILVQSPHSGAALVNVFTLAVLGVLTERVWGTTRWLVVVVLSGVVLNLMSVLHGVTSSGCSGVVYALGGSMVALGLDHRSRPSIRRLALVAVVLVTAALATGNFHGLAALVGAVLGRPLSGRMRRDALGHVIPPDEATSPS